MTNGEKIKEVFPNGIYTGSGTWMSMEYKEPTTKNDLAVNCVSREEVEKLVYRFLRKDTDDNIAFYEHFLDLPSVPSQEPRKGHWILTDVEGNKVWHCRCSECGKDPQDYIGGSEDWWLIRNNLPKFCPNCSADMREVKE